MLMDCSTVDATKPTGRDGELSESDVDDDYDELMLAMNQSIYFRVCMFG